TRTAAYARGGGTRVYVTGNDRVAGLHLDRPGGMGTL
ncbi:MAG: hypothetical protein QOK01_2785, partial [Alphaproteobacteria bacterium]|nr:hypothetical protein [Alphaproteobacteria bacterium]